jgi:photosystem II stability/assembly factor-like uncharacterized protein
MRVLRVCALACLIWVLSTCRNSGTEPQGCTVRLASGCWTFLGLDGKWITALAETPWGLYAGTLDDGVFRLDATGRWQGVGLNIARGYISALLYTPTTPPRLLATIGAKRDTAGTNDTRGAAYATEDGGRTWKPWDGGLDARLAARGNDAWGYALAMDPGNPDRLYMGLSYPIMRSNDGGQSWQYVWGSDDIVGGGIAAILVDPQRTGRVWAVGGTLYLHAAILRSNDWGDSWAFTDPTPTFDNTVLAIALDPAGSGRLLAAAGGGVIASDDSGVSWSYTFFGSPSAIASLGSALYVATSENLRSSADPQNLPLTDLGLYRTRDGGTIWDTLPVPNGSGGGRSLVVDSQGRLLIGTQFGSRRSGVWRLEP